MIEFLQQLDFGVVELILVGFSGFTIKVVVDLLKSKFKFISGVWTNLITLIVGSGFTAIYLVTFSTFTLDMWTGYSVFVFLASIIDHNILKTILGYLKIAKK